MKRKILIKLLTWLTIKLSEELVKTDKRNNYINLN